jgi:hypothetical protein
MKTDVPPENPYRSKLEVGHFFREDEVSAKTGQLHVIYFSLLLGIAVYGVLSVLEELRRRK